MNYIITPIWDSADGEVRTGWHFPPSKGEADLWPAVERAMAHARRQRGVNVRVIVAHPVDYRQVYRVGT